MTATEDPHDKKVFISYASKDGLQHAVKVKEYLSSHGITVFLERHDVLVGTPPWIRIGQEIADADILVLVGTRCAYDSYGVRLEISAALNQKRPVVTLRHDDAKIIEILLALKYADFTSEEELNQICKRISNEFDSIIEGHRTSFLVIEQEAKKETQQRPLFYVASGYSSEPAADISGLNETTLRNALSSMNTGYESSTIVPYVASIRRFDIARDSENGFVQIGRYFFHPLESFVISDIVVLFDDIGKSVALGERNLINEKLLEHRSSVEVPVKEMTLQRIREIVAELRREGFSPNTMLAPIDQYSTCHMKWLREEPQVMQWQQPGLVLALDGETRLRVFWSNRYVPQDEFIILDSGIGVWVVKPDPQTGKAFTAMISRSRLYPETRVEVLAKTVARYDLKRPTGMRILTPSS